MQIGMIVQFTEKAFPMYTGKGPVPKAGKIFLILARYYDASSGAYEYGGVELKHQDLIPAIPFPLPPSHTQIVWNDYQSSDQFVVLKQVKLTILPE